MTAMPKPRPTEFEFTLPRGLLDSKGYRLRQGVMRLTTARDEIEVQKHRQVQNNPAYGVLILFSRVITRLGTLTTLTPTHLEDLFSLDLAYLREFYNRINHQGNTQLPVQCPHCQSEFAVELTLAEKS